MQTIWSTHQRPISSLIFDQVYALLVRFSEKIQSIEDVIIRITAAWNGGLNIEWERFVRYFHEGTYFHYRCQGYVEALRVTGAYSSYSVNIWVNQLVYPAANNFMMAMSSYENVEKQSLDQGFTQFQTLDRLLKEFKSIADTILQYANQLNTLGPGFHPPQEGESRT